MAVLGSPFMPTQRPDDNPVHIFLISIVYFLQHQLLFEAIKDKICSVGQTRAFVEWGGRWKSNCLWCYVSSTEPVWVHICIPLQRQVEVLQTRGKWWLRVCVNCPVPRKKKHKSLQNVQLPYIVYETWGDTLVRCWSEIGIPHGPLHLNGQYHIGITWKTDIPRALSHMNSPPHRNYVTKLGLNLGSFRCLHLCLT